MVAPSHVLVFDLGSQRAGFLPKDDLDAVCASVGSRLGKAALLHEALLPVCCWLGWEFGTSPTREFLFCTQSWLNTRWHHQVCLGTGGSEQQGHKPGPGGINQGCTSLCTPISYGEHGPCRNPEGFTAAHGGFGDERCIFSCKMQWGFAPAAGGAVLGQTQGRKGTEQDKSCRCQRRLGGERVLLGGGWQEVRARC